MSLKPIPLSKPQSPAEPPSKGNTSPPISPSSSSFSDGQPQTSTLTLPSLKIQINHEDKKTPPPPKITCNFNDNGPTEKPKNDTDVLQNSSEAKKATKEADKAKPKAKREKPKTNRKPTKRQQASSSAGASSHDNPPAQSLKRDREDKSDKGPQRKKKGAEPPGIVLENKDQIRGLAYKTADKYGRALYNYFIQSTNYMYWKPAGYLPSELINAFENSIYYDGTLSKCPNPKCNNRMQKSSQSKYCSEECALEVARERLRMRIADYKAGDNGYRVPTFTPDNPPIPTRYPVITHFEKDGTPVSHEGRYSTVKTTKDEIYERISTLASEKDIVVQYKKGLEERIEFINAHAEALKSCPPSASSKAGDTESIKVAKVIKDCPICDKSYPIQSLISHFPMCRRRKELPYEWPASSYERPDRRVFCGVEVKVTKKQQQQSGITAPVFCRASKYSCPFHNPELEVFFKKNPENSLFALPVCGFPFDKDNFCTLPPSKCENHANWYPVMSFSLRQQLCAVSAWIEDMEEKIKWLNSCIIQQDAKVRKLEEAKLEKDKNGKKE